MVELKGGWTLWFTGLHGYGKTTIAEKLIEVLRLNKIPVILIDGDIIRTIISSDLGYSIGDRNAHMGRVAKLCKLISANGILSIACVASPTERSREYAGKVLKKIFQIYVKCPLEECEKRDVKGHYKKARNKEIGFENFVGVSLKFEEPKSPDIILDTEKESVEESVNKLLNKLKEKGIVKI